MTFKFCPVCGAVMTAYKVGRFSRERCPKCGHIHYHNSRPTASAIISRGGEILLTQRVANPARGQWDVPGGFLEEHELPEDALRREVKEELGTDILIGPLIGIFGPTLYPFGGQDGYNLDLYYEASLTQEQLTIGDDVVAIDWFDHKSLPKIAFPSVSQAIATWQRRQEIPLGSRPG